MIRRRQEARPEGPVSGRTGRSRRRWLLAGMIAACAGLCLLWLAPILIAHTPLRDRILAAALADFEGTVAVDSASFAWFSPVEVRGLAATDSAGRPLAKVAAIRCQQSLLSLLLHRDRLGPVRVEQPAVEIVLRRDGSNWGDALARYLAAPPAESQLADLKLEVEGGVVAVRDEETGQQLVLDTLNATLHLGGEQLGSIQADVSGRVAGGPAEAGLWSVKLDSQRSGEAGSVTIGQASARWQSLPVEPLVAIASRWLGPWQARGQASGEGTLAWDESGHAQASWNGVEVKDLLVRNAAWPASDALHTARLQSAGAAGWDAARLTLSQLEVHSGDGRFLARADLALPAPATLDTWSRQLEHLAEQAIHVEGELSLAAIARMFPATLRIRPGIAIQGGRIQGSLDGLAGGEPGLRAALTVADLEARDGSQAIRFDEPFTLQGTLRPSPAGPAVEDLVCQSGFLAIRGAGRIEQGAAEIRADLDQLVRQTSQLVDWGATELRGRVEGELRWERGQAQRVTAAGGLRVADFRLASPGSEPWTESALSVRWEAGIDLDGSRIASIASSTMSLEAGGDTLRVELVEPVAAPSQDSEWPVALAVDGDLQTWWPRLQRLVDVRDVRLAGPVSLTARARAGRSRVDAESLKLVARDVRAELQKLTIDEPRCELVAQGSWDAASQVLLLEDATATSSSLAIRGQQLRLPLGPATSPLTGSVSYRADLARLWAHLQPDAARSSSRLQGSLTGTLQASAAGGTTQIVWRGEAPNLALTTRVTRSANPLLQVSLQDGWQDACRGSQVSWTADIAGPSPSQRLATAPGAGPANGTNASSPLLSLLAASRLQGTAGVGWEAATVYGVALGTGKLQAELREGRLRFPPAEFALSGGTLRAGSWIELDRSPPVLNVEPGTLLDQVQLSDGMCRTWLRFVAPLLADATRAEGRFSLSLDKAAVPLQDPQAGDVSGQLQIHEAQVGAGPLAQQFLGLAQQLRTIIDGRPGDFGSASGTWLIVPNQSIPFAVRDRRVRHEGLTVAAGDLQIRTTGWVGFDDSLDLVAEMPVPASWVAGNPTLAPLQGTVLRIPVAGTFSQPRVDSRALQELGIRTAREAAGKLLEQQLQRGLQQLLTPRG